MSAPPVSASPRKVAFVVPRYGLDVVGGAELGARLLSERLVAAGWPVEVFTTCAVDARTWADVLPPGTTIEAGVTVHRFRSERGRDPRFDQLSGVLAHPEAATPDQERRFFEVQGPVCPDALDAAEASDADDVAFYPYLYHPTVVGLPRMRDRAVLHPAAHDEPPIRLPAFQEVFAAARGLVFHTREEQRLTTSLFPVANRPQIVLGLGVDPHPGDAVAARSVVGLGDDPYLLCLGRIDAGKGTETLARFFIEHKRRHPGPLRLVFAGSVGDPPPAHPDVVVAGRVDEETKWGLLRGAEVLVSPSAYESFSFVIMEAWLAGIPVVVNGRCEVTRAHCADSGGGLWFDGYASFEAIVHRLHRDRGTRQALAARGAAYVEARYRWPVVVERYQRFLASLDRVR